jgi:formylglycine-generating enzyme required for sulfatase activity
MARRWLLFVPAGVLALGVSLIVVGVRARRLAPEEGTAFPTLKFPNGTALVGGKKVQVAAFELDALEVSVKEYDACVRAGRCVLYASSANPTEDVLDRFDTSSGCRGGRPDRADDAMNCIDWSAADAYCKWVGKRLPSIAEWWLAVGSQHPEKAGELHRQNREEPYQTGEWTSSPHNPRGSAPSELVRWVGAWRTDRSQPERRNQVLSFAQPVLVRSVQIGFRCAR